jgi:hypothetical protein
MAARTADDWLFVLFEAGIVYSLASTLLKSRFAKKKGTAAAFVGAPDNPTRLLSVFAVLLAVAVVLASEASFVDGARASFVIVDALTMFYLFFVNRRSRLALLFWMHKTSQAWKARRTA